jgi:HEAT repeat protein
MLTNWSRWSVARWGLIALVAVSLSGCSHRAKPTRQMSNSELREYLERSSSVPELIDGLKHQQEGVREAAVKRLGEVQPRDTGVIAELVRVCVEDHTDFRWKTASLLKDLGADAVPALTEAFRTRREVEARWMAARVLQEIGPQSPETAAILAEGLRDESAQVRRAAAEVLKAMGPHARPALPALVELVGRELPAYRRGSLNRYGDQEWAEADALGALSRLGPDAEGAVPAASELLTLRPDGLAASAAIHLIEQLGPKGRAGWPAVMAALGSSDQQVRESASEALVRIGQRNPELVREVTRFRGGVDSQKAGAEARKAARDVAAKVDPASVPVLMAALRDGPPTHQREVLEALAVLGPDGKDAWELVLPLLGAADGAVRRAAAQALVSGGAKDRKVLDALVKALGDADEGVRRYAITGIGKFGSEAAHVVPALVTLLSDRALGFEAASALKAIGREAVPALIALVSQGNPPDAIWGAFGEAAVGPLTGLLGHKDPALRRHVALTLGRNGSPAAAAPLLEAWVAEESGGHRYKLADVLHQLAGVKRPLPEAIDGLERVPTSAAAAVPRLVDLLKVKRGEVGDLFSDLKPGESLEDIGKRMLEAEKSRSTAAGVRGRAAQALGLLGPAAKEAEPALVQALTDRGGFDVFIRSRSHGWDNKETWFVRNVAADALVRIDPKARERIPALDAVLREREGQAAAARREAEEERRKRQEGALTRMKKEFEEGSFFEKADAIGRHAQDAGPLAVPFLIRCLSGDDYNVQEAAVRALGRIGADGAWANEAKEALKRLRKRQPLLEKDIQVALNAIEASSQHHERFSPR